MCISSALREITVWRVVGCPSLAVYDTKMRQSSTPRVDMKCKPWMKPLQQKSSTLRAV
uniref:Uncharacterized protein n=1 Tax=Anguilla anguilla TaxID=7936 RepID=A0A0E9R3D2_ANGAN